MKKQQCLNLGLKYHIWVFLTKNTFLDIFGQEFLKNYVIFEISTLKFTYLQNLTEKQKCQNLGPKTPDLGILGWDLKATL